MSNISLILKYLRTQNGDYQKTIANNLNIETNTYGSWERGNTEPPIDMLITLAKYFNVTVDYLVGIENEDYTKILNNDNINELHSNEIELLGIFRNLNKQQKKEILNFAHYTMSKK